jgi:hypothetical protein
VKLASVAFSLLALIGLSACDQLNDQLNKQKDNGKAIGAACRHSGRALEDCYRRNAKTPKADIYAGWREMNEYMLAKRIDIVPPPSDAPESAPQETHNEAPVAASAVTDTKKPNPTGR